jgi:hypothetical protein
MAAVSESDERRNQVRLYRSAFDFRVAVLFRALRDAGYQCSMAEVAQELRTVQEMDRAYAALSARGRLHSPAATKPEGIKRPLETNTAISGQTNVGVIRSDSVSQRDHRHARDKMPESPQAPPMQGNGRQAAPGNAAPPPGLLRRLAAWIRTLLKGTKQ